MGLYNAYYTNQAVEYDILCQQRRWAVPSVITACLFAVSVINADQGIFTVLKSSIGYLSASSRRISCVSRGTILSASPTTP
jgi:uncharacterized sodium:solute symporter family permease YidK